MSVPELAMTVISQEMMLDHTKQVSDHPNSSKNPWAQFCLPHTQISFKRNETSSLRLQAHLYKHPADAELHYTTALFKAEKVYFRSKVAVIHLLLAVRGGDGGSSGGLWWWDVDSFAEALACTAVHTALWQPTKGSTHQVSPTALARLQQPHPGLSVTVAPFPHLNRESWEGKPFCQH